MLFSDHAAEIRSSHLHLLKSLHTSNIVSDHVGDRPLTFRSDHGLHMEARTKDKKARSGIRLSK